MIDKQTAAKLLKLQSKAKRRRLPTISLHGHSRDNQSDGITASQISPTTSQNDIIYPEELKTDHIRRRLNNYMQAIRMI